MLLRIILFVAAFWVGYAASVRAEPDYKPQITQHRQQALCWYRNYDKQHQVKHPEQLVQEFYVRVFPVTSDNEDIDGGYGMEAYVAVRGVQDYLMSMGFCRSDSRKGSHTNLTLRCSDGKQGGFILKPNSGSKEESILIDIQEHGRLSLYENRDHKGTELETVYNLVPGIDDRVFRLYPTTNKCISSDYKGE